MGCGVEKIISSSSGLCLLFFRVSLLPHLQMELNLERTTWQLLHALYSDRIEAEMCQDDDDMVTDIMVRFLCIPAPCNITRSRYP